MKKLQKMWWHYFLTAFTFCLCIYNSSAKNLIKGQIIDTAKQPLSGAAIPNINSKGKSKMVSKGNGEFGIAHKKGDKIETTIVGSISQQVQIQNFEKISVTHPASDNSPHEVIAMAYVSNAGTNTPLKRSLRYLQSVSKKPLL